MNFEVLEQLLTNDIKKLGIVSEFNLRVRPYSSQNYGTYKPKYNMITIYAYSDKDCKKLYSYQQLLLTSVHEAIHCRQYADPNFKRVKGVMHNPEFYRLYKIYSLKAKLLLHLRRLQNARETTLCEKEREYVLTT